MNEDRAFDSKKQHILNQISLTDESNPDASPKGTLDIPLIPLISLINDHQDMFTTSSCSGRVSVFLEGEKGAQILGKSHEKLGGKGEGGRWLFVTHKVGELDGDWWTKVKSCEVEIRDNGSTSLPSPRRYVLYKFEAMILHVKCRNFSSASKLYTAAMDCGFRESGIGPNNLVAIRISIKLDIPIGYVEGGTVVPLVTDDYVEEMVEISKKHFEKNTRKINELENAVRKLIDAGHHQRCETKEERRIRKRQEGLQRKAELEREVIEQQSTEDNIEYI
jgi:tRNA wybutosine-synthesizing protein 3